MGPLFWLIIVAVIVAFAALTGIKPKKGRQVARTQLMSVARVVLILLALIVAYLAYRANAGG